jgi:2-polyprenyl-3-methyl-5-hydroxy-6-metoxy-1,4-benzoquinol methylase
MNYLAENDTFYSDVMSQNRLYATRHPNYEEAARASAILKTVSVIRQYYLDVDATPTILDVGCGRGWLTTLISAFGQTEGIDPAKGMIDLARRYFSEIAFNCETLTDRLRSTAAKTYDIVVSSEVIEHVPRAQKRDFVEEIRDILKPGGHCIITTPRRELLWLFNRNHTAVQLIEDWLTEKELKSLLTQCGFMVVKQDRAFPMKPRSFYHSERGRRLDTVLTGGRLGFLARSIEHMLSMYQVWCFRKVDGKSSKLHCSIQSERRP